MTADGSTATVVELAGSYDPAPAPRLTTVRTQCTDNETGKSRVGPTDSAVTDADPVVCGPHVT